MCGIKGLLLIIESEKVCNEGQLPSSSFILCGCGIVYGCSSHYDCGINVMSWMVNKPAC